MNKKISRKKADFFQGYWFNLELNCTESAYPLIKLGLDLSQPLCSERMKKAITTQLVCLYSLARALLVVFSEKNYKILFTQSRYLFAFT